MIIQDDAIVCQNFTPMVERLIGMFPEHPVCLFCPGISMRSRRSQQKAIQSRKSFFILNRQDFLPVVAVLWPKSKARDLLAWSQEKPIAGLRTPYRSDDAVAGAWMRMRKQDVYVMIPSIVQHPDDVPPVKGGHHKEAHGHDRGRVAFSFCAGDPLELEWRA